MSIAADTHKRIVAAAIEHFTHFGYTKTSVEGIAHSANTAKATIYYHFPGKEELFIAAIREKAEEFFQTLKSSIESTENFEDKLSLYLQLPMKYIFDHMPILMEALRSIPQSYLLKLEESRLNYRSRMNVILSDIMAFGKNQNIVNDEIDSGRISELINDWFMMGETCFDANEKERIIKRLDRDHELIIQVLLYGIVKGRTK